MASRSPQSSVESGEEPRRDVAENGARTRSTITFPYGSLKDAEQIAHALHEDYGGVATPDQLAASLDSTPRSGTFRVKVATTRIFGVIVVSRNKIALTDRGQRLVDPQTRNATRVEAFLSVPLFDEVHEAFKGRKLPPDGGLEKKIAELGVSPKQTARARQSLQRSAELAGFLKQGRLVRPATKGEEDSKGKPLGKESLEDHLQPAAVPLPDLWIKLLDNSESWSAERIQRYVRAARELHEVELGDDD